MADVFYCELSDVYGVGVSENKLIQLTDDNNTGAVNMDNFNACRKAAAAQINGFAMAKYSRKVPFNPVPDAVRTIAAVLTKYYLYQRRSAVNEDIQKAYDDQITILKMLANGTFKIEQDDAPVTEDAVNFTDKGPEDRAFHISNMAGYLP